MEQNILRKSFLRFEHLQNKVIEFNEDHKVLREFMAEHAEKMTGMEYEMIKLRQEMRELRKENENLKKVFNFDGRRLSRVAKKIDKIEAHND